MKRLIVLIVLSFALGVPAAETNAPTEGEWNARQKQIASLESEIVAKAEEVAELSKLGDQRQVVMFQVARFKAVYGDSIPTNPPPGYWTNSLMTSYRFDAEEELTFLAKKLAAENEAVLAKMLAEADADDLAMKAMAPHTLVERLDAIRRGTSKGKYSEAAIVAALRRKGFEVLPAEPGLPPQIRRLPEAPAK